MTDTMLDFTRTHSHRNDPDTSTAAAHQQSRHVTARVKAAILDLLRENPEGLTAYRATELYFENRAARGWPDVHSYSVNRRMSDLVHKDKKIEDSGRRGPTDRSTAAVWVIA